MNFRGEWSVRLNIERYRTEAEGIAVLTDTRLVQYCRTSRDSHDDKYGDFKSRYCSSGIRSAGKNEVQLAARREQYSISLTSVIISLPSVVYLLLLYYTKADSSPAANNNGSTLSLTILGVLLNNSLTATEHVSTVLACCASLLRVLRSHSLPVQSLKDVFQATVVRKLLYCARAWSSFCSAADCTRLNSFYVVAIN